MTASALALFVVLKFAGAAYLLWLAWRMFGARLLVTLGNPKIMIFYMALLPTLIDLRQVNVLGWAELTATMVAVLAAVDLAWTLLAANARRLLTSAKAVRNASRTSASMMAGAAAMIASR